VGDRLVFQNGIVALLVASGLIILISHGDTTVAVNLYALGVFLAFTLSQTGMVVHWWRQHGRAWLARLAMNAVGALSTLLVLVVIVISKFSEGAWTVVIAIPLLVIGLARIRRRYRRVQQVLALPAESEPPLRLPQRHEPIGNRSIVWIPTFTRPTLEALRYAATISDAVMGVWVRNEQEDPERIRQQWRQLVGDDPQITLTVLESPFSSLIDPFVSFVEAEEAARPDQALTIVMPMAIPRYRFDGLLLNQRGLNMRMALDAHHNRVFSLVRYYLPA
jgi:PAS domain-containing protein